MKISVLLPHFINENFLTEKTVKDLFNEVAKQEGVSENASEVLDFSPSNTIITEANLQDKNSLIKIYEDATKKSDVFLVFCDSAYAAFFKLILEEQISEKNSCPLVPMLVGAQEPNAKRRYKYWFSIKSELATIFSFLALTQKDVFKSTWTGVLCVSNTPYGQSYADEVQKSFFLNGLICHGDESCLYYDEERSVADICSRLLQQNQNKRILFLIGLGDKSQQNILKSLLDGNFNGLIIVNAALKDIPYNSGNRQTKVFVVDVPLDYNGRTGATIQNEMVRLFFSIFMRAQKESVDFNTYINNVHSFSTASLDRIDFIEQSEIVMPLVVKDGIKKSVCFESNVYSALTPYRAALIRSQIAEELIKMRRKYDINKPLSSFYATGKALLGYFPSDKSSEASEEVVIWMSAKYNSKSSYSIDSKSSYLEVAQASQQFIEYIARQDELLLESPIQIVLSEKDCADNGTSRVYINSNNYNWTWAEINVSSRKEELLTMRDGAEMKFDLYDNVKKANTGVDDHVFDIETSGAHKFFDLVQVLSSAHKKSILQQYLYLFPLAFHGANACFCVCVSCAKKIPFLTIMDLNVQLKNLMMSYWSVISAHDIQLQSIKAAIGSIMSRNGSHNIGSHVLAALSHNVGTMPDDRVLYQYIQHRMDYIATVTTDFPTWTQPTMLLGSLMKGFLSQRHLLDHIAESEKLSAWKFQGAESLDKDHKGKHWIEFHVRRKMKNGYNSTDGYKELIEYPNGDVRLEQDVALAIPGGAVGHHAFYTILENIIRNAAKHDWSKRTKGIGENEKGDLQIYIDFDNENKDDVEFKIWTKVTGKTSSSNDESEAMASSNAFLSKKEVEDWHKKLDAGDNKQDLEKFARLSLHHRLQILIERPFINDNGQLRRENWGLAEMKISAGYLRRSGIATIGGLNRDDYNPENALILPTAEKKTINVDGEDVSGTYLEYKFSIPKPRELLIIVENIDSNDDVKSRIEYAEELGVYVKTWQEILNDGNNNARALELNYRYVVHYALTKDVLINQDGVKFPFRVLSGAKATDVNDMVPKFGKFDDVVKQLLEGKTSNGEDVDAEKAVENALKDVYEGWCRHIVEKYRVDIFPNGDKKSSEKSDEVKIGLLIAPTESDNTGGHSLISDADILKYVMRECFEECVKRYRAFYVDLPETESAMLKEFEKLCERPREIDEVPLDKNKSKTHDNIARFLHKWVSDALNKNDGDGGENALLQKIKKDIEKSYHVEERTASNVAEMGNDDADGDDWMPNMAINIEMEKNTKVEGDRAYALREIERILNKGSVAGFIGYIESVHEQVKSLFKQYEENIVSLPDGYRPKKDKGGDRGGDSRKIEDGLGFAKVAFNVNAAKNTEGVKWIAYRRHDNSLTDKIAFAEPLSGTQSYLTQIVDLVANLQTSQIFAKDVGLCARLLENGLMRMLVIDERVAKFVREHETEVGSFYESMGISVLDDELKFSEDESKGNADRKRQAIVALNAFIKDPQSNPKPLSDKFEILIIHQGILDKWFPDDKNDKVKMAVILEGFKKMVKYVVITTGRGTPANIPEDAHLIPFAVVEAALFRKYPEKLILVDAVMNVLAIGKHANEGG